MSIICATDFSPEAIAATTLAAELSRQRAVDLRLVFVLPADTARAFGDQVLAKARETLEGEAVRVRKLGAVVTSEVLVGKLHRALALYAAEHKATLVVAGDAAHDPALKASGALARLSQHLEAPLWAVRHPERLLAWARGERILKVMVGVDQTHSTDVAVRWVEQLTRYGKVELVGGHVYFPAAEHHRLGLPLPRTWDENHPDLTMALQRELAVKLPHRIRLKPAVGRISDHLCALAADEQADLLVLGTHHRTALGRLWSVSEQCLQSALMSVVCVPSAFAAGTVEPSLPRVDRVLIATDFTPTGDLAVGWGLGILSAGGTATLVHVSPAPLTGAQEGMILERLLSRVPAEARRRGCTIEAHALVGLNPVVAILTAAERFTSSVICLGSRGNTGLSKLVLGSTAQGVIEASTRPVLVARPQEP